MNDTMKQEIVFSGEEKKLYMVNVRNVWTNGLVRNKKCFKFTTKVDVFKFAQGVKAATIQVEEGTHYLRME